MHLLLNCHAVSFLLYQDKVTSVTFVALRICDMVLEEKNHRHQEKLQINYLLI